MNTSVQTIGCIGEGQLGRMLALAGYPLGINLRVLGPKPNSSAGQVCPQVLGEYGDLVALDQFADGLALVTYEFENVPTEALRHLASKNITIFPPPKALAIVQDRLHEKNLLWNLKIPTVAFADITSEAELATAVKAALMSSILKTRQLGYDGKGQYHLTTPEEVGAAWQAVAGVPCILEEFVQFERELSLIAVRSKTGETSFYPLVENYHHNGVLRLTRAPAPRLTAELQATAEKIGRELLHHLEYVGVLAIELFQRGDQLLVNELAPRVHNSGHWTIEGSATSQFENHLRAVTGLPLGPTTTQGSWAMVNLIGQTPTSQEVLEAVPKAKLHLYGKDPRPTKLGHLTLRGNNWLELQQQLERIKKLPGVWLPDGVV